MSNTRKKNYPNMENGNTPNRIDTNPMINNTNNFLNLQNNFGQNPEIYINSNECQNIANSGINHISNNYNNEMDSKQDDLNSSISSNERKNKKPFMERVGDWVCVKCKNLNFSFRVMCNRCQMTKFESEKLTEQYNINYQNYIKFNEMMQQRILMTHPMNIPNNPAMFMANNHNLSSPGNNFVNNADYSQQFMEQNFNVPRTNNNTENLKNGYFQNMNFPIYNNIQEDFNYQEDYNNQAIIMDQNIRMKVNGQITNNNQETFSDENFKKNLGKGNFNSNPIGFENN